MAAQVIKLRTKQRRRPAAVGADEPKRSDFMGQLVVAVVSGLIVALVLRSGKRR